MKGRGRVINERVHDEATGQWKTVTTYWLNGKEVSKAEFDAAFPSKMAELTGGGVEVNAMCRPAGWPMVSLAMGCLPKQVPEANEFLKKNGSACRHNKDGMMVVPTELERRKAMKLKGQRDNNAFN